jgi:uncharacterized protein YggU (UPF0235/DUF167 family)
MAKPKADFPTAAAIRALVDEERCLAVRVTPGARMEALEIAGGRLLAKVRAKPEDGEANAAVQDLLARALGVAATRVQMLRGATSREKQFRIDG